MDWRYITCLACTYGFLKEFRPSDAYLTRYLREDKNLTIQQIDHVIYPWYTYFNLVWLVPVLLLTDICRYKPMVIIDSAARVGTWALLLWSRGLTAMKLSQVVFALSSAATISYYGYIYASVSTDKFQKVTSLIHWADLIGKFTGYLIGQLFVSFDVLDLYHLNLITFVDMCAGLILSLFFPRVTELSLSQLHAQSRTTVSESGEPENEHLLPHTYTAQNKDGDSNTRICEKLRPGIVYLFRTVKGTYASRAVRIWSVWMVLTSLGYFQVSGYIQNIWAVIAPHREDKKLYNGAVEAAGTLLASFGVLLVGFVSLDWSIRGRGEALMAVIFSVNCISMAVIATTRNIWVAYVLYDVFRTTYHAALTLAAVQISKSVPCCRYGFVFGCNIFVTQVLGTILTAVVIDEVGMNVNVRLQFEIYGGYFGLLTVIFFIVAVVNMNRDNHLSQHNTSSTTVQQPSINQYDGL